MKAVLTGIGVGIVLGLVFAITYSGYQVLDDLERSSDLFWE